MSCVCSCPPKRFIGVLRPGRLFLDVFFRLCPSVLTCRDNHEFENMKYLFQWWDIMNQVDMGHRPWEKVPGGTQLGQTRGGRSTLWVPKWDFSWMVCVCFKQKPYWSVVGSQFQSTNTSSVGSVRSGFLFLIFVAFEHPGSELFPPPTRSWTPKSTSVDVMIDDFILSTRWTSMRTSLERLSMNRTRIFFLLLLLEEHRKLIWVNKK